MRCGYRRVRSEEARHDSPPPVRQASTPTSSGEDHDCKDKHHVGGLRDAVKAEIVSELRPARREARLVQSGGQGRQVHAAQQEDLGQAQGRNGPSTAMLNVTSVQRAMQGTGAVARHVSSVDVGTNPKPGEDHEEEDDRTL
ncbi:hypothetical protein CYMTET_54485 [Cymbomonas tetramitiformis]|uniref:Uncharacterized protein n=1 Tax=Cymbomonas tetramitiformis TaxID=36881 RepID=A0AAE0BEU9_9CHLO|nr:hypothetical protein CYMTET_54485 [Cymbomonas tetramitiformis]